MSEAVTPDAPVALSLRLAPALSLDDDELFALCAANPELRLERTRDGDLIVMTPAGGASGSRNAYVVGALLAWARKTGGWSVFDSSTGFLLPNGAMRSPDAACVARARLAALSAAERERFLPLCPDVVVEIASPTDRLPAQLAKMEEYRDCGARLGWLFDPGERRVHVFRPGAPEKQLDRPASLAGEPELAGFVLALAPVWDPFG